MRRPIESGVGHEAMLHIVGGDRAFFVEATTILWNEHEAGVGSVVNALGPGITDPPSYVVGEAFVEVDQKSIPNRIPFGISLEVHCETQKACGNCTPGKYRASHPGRNHRRKAGKIGAIHILESQVAAGIVEGELPSRIRLIHIEETSQVNAAHMQTGNVEDCVLERLEFDSQAYLCSVGRLVIFVEAHDHRVERWIRIDCGGEARP